MSVEYTLDHVRRIVLSRASNVVTEEELMAHLRAMRELFAAGTLDIGWSQLADFTATTQLEKVSSSGIRQLAAENPWPKTARRVIVAPVTETFGLGRMYQLMTGAEDEHLTVVRSEAEALSFLEFPTASPP